MRPTASKIRPDVYDAATPARAHHKASYGILARCLTDQTAQTKCRRSSWRYRLISVAFPLTISAHRSKLLGCRLVGALAFSRGPVLSTYKKAAKGTKLIWRLRILYHMIP